MKKALAPGLAVVLGLSFGPVGEAAPPAYQLADTQSVREAFEGAKGFWIAQGIGAMAATELAIVQGSDTFTCPKLDGTITTDAAGATYYCVSKHTVVITAATIRAQNELGKGKTSMDFTTEHEVGHARDAADDTLTAEGLAASKDNPAIAQALELNANCWAGRQMADRYPPAELAMIANYLGERIGAGRYASGTQQAAAFVQGVQGGDCR